MALNRAALAVFDFDLFLGGDDDIKNLVLHPHGFDTLLQVVANLVFIARIAVDHIPGTLVAGAFQDCTPNSSGSGAQR